MSQSHTSSCSSKLLILLYRALRPPACVPLVTNMCSLGENSTSNHLSNQPISTRLRFPLQLPIIHIYFTAPSVGAKRRARTEIPTSSHDFTVYTLRYKKRREAKRDFVGSKRAQRPISQCSMVTLALMINAVLTPQRSSSRFNERLPNQSVGCACVYDAWTTSWLSGWHGRAGRMDHC
jgi:hypothetical protein